jgi:hypothetical protein
MKYLRKNKTKKIIGGIKESMPPFNSGNTFTDYRNDAREKRVVDIPNMAKEKRQQILEFIIDEISKTRDPNGKKYNNNEKTYNSQSGDLYKDNIDVIKSYLKNIYYRNLMMDFYELHDYLRVIDVNEMNGGKYIWEATDDNETFKQTKDTNVIDKLQPEIVMQILLYNYLYAKLQEPRQYFYDMYFRVKKQKTFFDKKCEYEIVEYNLSGNPGFFFINILPNNSSDEYFADVSFNMEGEIPKRCVTKITKQGGFMGIGGQVPFDGNIYTIEDLKDKLKDKLPNIEPKKQATTGGKKRRLKRKNKTKKGGKTPKETYYKYSPNTGKRIRVTTKKNKK